MAAVVIAFAMLFLGLVVGPHPVELIVESDVREVVFELDGRQVARLTAPPWEAEIDLGATLLPHELTAIGLDAAGSEIARVRQWINLPREPAGLALSLTGDDPRRPTAGRFLWRHLEFGTSSTVGVRVDGRAIPMAADGSFSLPPLAPDEVHLIVAEAEFEDGSRYTAETTYGGPAGTALASELTGIQVLTDGDGSPSLEALAGKVLAAERPVRVVAVDKTPARVVMVIENSALPELRRLATYAGNLARGAPRPRQGEQVEFLFPVSRVTGRRDLTSRLFIKSQTFTRADGTFSSLLTRVRSPVTEGVQRLADAVAVAAIEAAADSRPRAVVLVLGPDPTDNSLHAIAEVQSYFRALDVPLLVWSTGRVRGRNLSEDRLPLTRDTPWGEALDISTLARVLSAEARLRSVLDRQHTLWVEGSHLPHTVTLAPGVPLARAGE